MPDQLLYVFVLLIIAIPIIVFRWQFRQFRSGASTKPKAVALFVAYAILPMVAYLSLYFALVGFEEATGRSVITEGMSRGLIPIVGWGIVEVVLLTMVLGVVVMFVRKPASDGR